MTANPHNYRYSKSEKKCRLCQYYAQQYCKLLNRDTRGSYVCDMWMPIFRVPLDLPPSCVTLAANKENSPKN